MKNKLLIYTCLILCASFSKKSTELTITSHGKSSFSIVIPADAPISVQHAAQELQRDIELATGVKFPLQKDIVKVTGPFISLGSTRQAKTANISSDSMSDESFRIVTKDGNLYIIGTDTPGSGWPDTTSGRWTKNNGVSNGTANGVYTFLEDYLDVRWLMPGEIGRDVPNRNTFAIPIINRTEVPKFSMRRLPFIQWYADSGQSHSILAWMAQQKLGGATSWNFSHNWWRTINKSLGGETTQNVHTSAVKKLYKEHPDWFAMDKSGKRPYPQDHYSKLETTNPGLVKWFAEQAIKTLRASKRPIAYSLSPSDGRGWSQSPQSKALYDPPPSTPEPNREDKVFVSSLVIKWYDEISRIVAKEYPQGHLTGFIYSTYIYPPTKVSNKLPENFSPMIAPGGDYGYKLYRKSAQKYFHTVMDYWSKVITGDWFYYDLPNQLLQQDPAIIGRTDGANFPGSTGIITPVAPEILNIIFPQLIKSHINGVNIYGNPSCSNAALSNYVVAKMEWNPTLNAHDVEKEWLDRAYGLLAGAVMEQFYENLDGWFRDYYRKNKRTSYKIGLTMLKELYGAHYPEMEKIFLRAKSQNMSGKQQKRLQLIEDNLIVLQWRLRNLHYLPQNFKSPLQRSDAKISILISKDNPGFPLFPGITTVSKDNRSSKPLPWKIHLSKSTLPAGKSKSTMPKWNDGQFLIYAGQDGSIRITTQEVTHSAYFAAYEIKNQKGKIISSGIFNTATPIIFPAKAGESYMLIIPSRKPVNFQLQMQNAAVATGYLQGSTLQLSSEKNVPVYVFYVPDKKQIFSVVKSNNGVIIYKKKELEK